MSDSPPPASMKSPINPGSARKDADIDVITRSVSESWFPGERRPNLESFDPRGTARPTIGDLTRRRAGSLVKRGAASTGAASEVARDKFGMWDGVVARCLLNIWGVIMYLRTGWVVGTAGVIQAIIIVVLCSTVTTLTTLSLSAICTNGEVQGGGPYFLISRALGPEYGGAVGIMFYIANTVVLAIYVIGFSEGLVDVIKTTTGDFITSSFKNDVRLFGVITMLFMLVMAFVGIKAIVRFQLGLLVVLIASIITFFVATVAYSSDADIGFTGYDVDTLSDNMGPDFGDESFFTVFAIFFPAVTGIVAGANISGDLKDPGASIPRGTLYAIFGSTIVYILLVLAFGFTLTRTAPDGGLQGDFLIMIHVAKQGSAVLYGGLYAATLSSAIASMVGAPRVLMAFARDGIVNFLQPFAVSWGPNEEPLRAYAVTFIIALPLVIAADINFVSPFVTNFFLTSYALINYACFAQTFAKSPGWRPSFKYSNIYTSGIGCGLCVIVMFLIDTKNNCVLALATCFIGILLYKYVEWKKPDVNWGAASAGRRYMNAHHALLDLERAKVHVKNFRPQYLVLAGDMTQRPHLVKLMGLLRKGRGVSVFGRLLAGKLEPLSNAQRSADDRVASLANITPYFGGAGSGAGAGADGNGDGDGADGDDDNSKFIAPEQFAAARAKNQEFLKLMSAGEMKVKGFSKVFCTEDFTTGVLSMMELVGLGRLEPNTVVLGYQTPELSRDPNDPPEVDQDDYVSVIRTSMNFGFNVVIAKNLEKMDFTKRRSGNIDIWWLSDDGGLTLLVAHLLSQHPLWRHCKLRAMVLSDASTMAAKIRKTKTLLAKLRFPVKVVPVTTTRTLPSTESLATFNQLSIGPTTFSAGKFQPRRALGDIFNLAAADRSESKLSGTVEVDEEVDSDDDSEQAAVAAAEAKEKARRDKAEEVVNKRLVLLGEYIGSCSSDADMTIASLPVPSSEQRSELYMARLGMMTQGVGPILLVRGNQESVMTFSS